MREFWLLKLAFTGWWIPDPVTDDRTTFSYHRESGWGAFLAGILLIVVFESVAVRMFLHSWNPTFTYFHTALAVYGALWLLGDYQALKKLPIVLGPTSLRVRLGLRRDFEIPRDQIAAVHEGHPRELDAAVEVKRGEFVREAKLPGYAAVSVMGRANVYLVLKAPLAVPKWFGGSEKLDRIGLEVDAPQAFVAALSGALGKPS